MSRADRIRELPSYTATEAAHYLNLPTSTVRHWALGRKQYQPLINPAATDPLILSFFNLVELHVLAAMRRDHEIAMAKVRSAIEFLYDRASSDRDRDRPLLSAEFQTNGLDLFVEKYGDLINVSRDGQLGIKAVLSEALKRIVRDPAGVPIRLFPFTHASKSSESPMTVVIDPALSAGRPVLVGTGLATEIIAERFKAGETTGDLAFDYGRTEPEIWEAIRCELKTAA